MRVGKRRIAIRRWLAMLLVMVMAAGLLPIGVWAAEGGIQIIKCNKFSSDPVCSTNIFGQPAGTLFQLDQDGNQTEVTGFNKECVSYKAYTSEDSIFYFAMTDILFQGATASLSIDGTLIKDKLASAITLQSIFKGQKKKPAAEGTKVELKFVNKTDSEDTLFYTFTVYGVDTDAQEAVIQGISVAPRDYFYLPWDAEETENRIYVPEQTEAASVTFDTASGVKLYAGAIGNENELGKNDSGKYEYRTTDFKKMQIIAAVKNEALGLEKYKTYEFSFIKRSELTAEYDREVIDYRPAAGQFARRLDIKNGEGDFVLEPVTRFSKYLSLGGFGGYATFKFKEPVKNDEKNPYGIDFLVYGNGFEYGNNRTPELGNVLVSEDGQTWYTLAGSRHYELMTRWNETAKLRDGTTTSAVLLAKKGENNVEGVAPMAVFGYADYHKCSEILNAEGDYRVTSIAGNPYAKTHIDDIGDGFDLSWAVDAMGKPAALEQISYVRVQTGVDIVNGTLGENSAEVGTLTRAVSDSEAVGVTAEPGAFTVNGTDVLKLTPDTVLNNGKIKYFQLDLNDPSAPAAKVVVQGAAEDHISINNELYDGTAKYTGLFAKDGSRMVRVILQNGEKEPLVYVINCTGGGDPSTSAELSSITLTPGDMTLAASGGAFDFRVQNSIEKVKLTIDSLNPEASIQIRAADSEPIELISGTQSPAIDLAEGSNTFDVTVTSTDKSNTSQAVLNIIREKKDSSGEAKGIKVTFTLTGDDKHGENGKHNTSTWIEKTSVEVPKNSTVKYLTDMMLYNAGRDFDDTDGTYISKIEGPDGWLGEFDNGPNSGWMYRQNGIIANVGYASRIMSEGDNIKWFYTDDYKKESGYEGGWDPSDGGNSGASQGNSATSSVDTTAKTDSNGRATASVSSSDIKSALDKAVAAAKEKGKNTVAEVRVNVKADSKATSVETSVPASSVKDVAKADNAKLTISTPLGDQSFDQKALSAMTASAGSGDIKFTIGTADQTKLPDAVKKALENKAKDRPVFDLSITAGGKSVTSFSGGKAAISLPYTLKTGEKAAGVCIYYVDDTGVMTLIKDGRYDEKGKKVSFTTDHFSRFVISYDEKAGAGSSKFTDIKSGDWFYENVMYLVEKGIIKGKTETTFAPGESISRAEFAQILYGMAKAEAAATTAGVTAGAVTSGAVSSGAVNSVASVFNDVKATDWFAPAVAWAYEKGIISGVKNADGTNSFAPNAMISRQDLAVMITGYADKVAKKALPSGVKEISFADSSQIGAYAKDAVSIMQRAGIISGKTQTGADGKKVTVFAPRNNATRAEAATMIAAFLRK